MITMQPGGRSKLSEALDPSQPFTVELAVNGIAIYDFSCFGLNDQGKNENDSYYVFYGNNQSPQGEIKLEQDGNPAPFLVNLGALPPWIAALHFTVNIDGPGTMGEIQSCAATLKQNGATAFQLTLQGGDFNKQKALIILNIYKKNEWRVAVIANGFDGGLAKLCESYGIDVTDDGPAQPSVPPPQPAPAQTVAPMPAPPPAAQEAPASQPAVPLPTVADGDDNFPHSEDDWV